MAMPDQSISRRDAIRLGVGTSAALALGGPASWLAASTNQTDALIQRTIPSSGERLPVVGIGTAINYERPTAEQIPVLREVLRKFAEMGGRVVDTAPSYGQAEAVVGDALSETRNRDKYFLATKVSVGGRGRRAGGEGAPAGDRATAESQMQESLRRLKTDRVDLMQIWNVSSPELIAPVLDEWKAAKKIRYTGITSSFKGQYPQLEEAMKAHKYDFVQIDLAIDNRSSQERILPLAADRGMGVLINLPFGRTRVFQKVLGKPLPDWAKDIDATSWAQIFLKYIISNPAVTAVIPGTQKVEFLVDNLGAARGRLPDAAMRRRIESYFDAL